MPSPVVIPRINNNDDVVKLSHLFVKPGESVRAKALLAEIETDKASFEIEAESDGFILRIDRAIGDMCDVGSTLLWMGASAEESVPEATTSKATKVTGDGQGPTIKALLLLNRYGLDAAVVPSTGERLTAVDVENYVRAKGINAPRKEVSSKAATEALPNEPGRLQPMSPQERGMVRTVTWHRDQAVAGYIEFPYDPSKWDNFAAAFQERHELLMNPMLSLMAWHLSKITLRYPKLNATISGDQMHFYNEVNLGFTVQSGEMLLMPVVRAAQTMEAPAFVEALGGLQRKAMKLALKPDEAAGATVSFTSMARWGISRHTPILPPNTSFMVAHSSPFKTPEGSGAVLGACYDHRVLTGFDVARALRELATPPELDSTKVDTNG
jgi:pyruvate/2-oxoglutarate dehydrogenase complex dihydrolipoamide acyltransferase (E2) component